MREEDYEDLKRNSKASEEEEYIKDLEPASTRTKIVIKLKGTENKDTGEFEPSGEGYEYELDEYDKMRMQLMYDK